MKIKFSIDSDANITILDQDQETYIEVNKATLPFEIEVTANEDQILEYGDFLYDSSGELTL